jgi:hypothetical protein
MRTFKQYLQEKFTLTLQYHDKLNPVLWNSDGTLKDGTAKKLLDTSYDFVKFSGVSKSRIKDIVVTGGNTNFNYTPLSDLDVHIMTDESGIDDSKLYLKKGQYQKEHADMNIFGIQTEFYIQNFTEHFPKDQGVYSILNESWVLPPTHLDVQSMMDDPKIIGKIKYYIHHIEKYLIPDGTEKEIFAFKEKLFTMRSDGLGTNGEFSLGNMIYKDLRNRGLIDKINNRLESIRKDV